MSRWVMGVQPVRELLRARASEVRVLRVVQEEGKLSGLAKLASDQGVEVVFCSRPELDKLARGGRHQGAIAEARDLKLFDKRSLLDALDEQEQATVVLLDGVVDPQNFGAVLRSAVALGAPWVVFAEHAAAPLTAATFRASAGAVEHAKLSRVKALPDLIRELTERNFQVLLLDPEGDTELSGLELGDRVAVVVGAEEKGARPAVRKACTHRCRLAMRGPLGSLNASVATAIALYEVSRRLRTPS